MTTTGNDGEQSVLAGTRVLDLSGLAGQYTGRLLADLGADVIKIEPPGGDPVRFMPPFADDQPGPDRGLRWLAYNSNKSSVVLDLTSAEGRDRILEMARSTDVMLDSYEPGYLASIGLSDEALRAANPRLITVSVTLFGESGPYGSYSGSDLHAMALSGLMTIQGDNEQPPATAPLDQAYILTCLHAAHGVFYALMARRKTGRGQHVEVSMHEVLANVFFQIIRYSATSEIGERIGAGGNIAPYNIFKCKDGWVSLAVLLPPQAKAFFDWVGEPALQDEFWLPIEARQGENMQFIDSLVAPFIEQFTVADFVEQAQARRLPAARVNRPGDFADNPQFTERGYFTTVEHPAIGQYPLPGAPFRMTETPIAPPRRAPLLDEHAAEFTEWQADPHSPHSGESRNPSPLPLEGVRVLDFTRIWAGPYCTRLLADYGAEVIKVESSLFDTGNRVGTMPYVADLNRNKLGITLDLHHDEARDVAKRIAAVSDLVIDNFALGVIDRFGLGYDELVKVNPDIIQVNMPGWGSVGPLRDHVAFGFNLVSVSGLSYMWGHPESEPNARCKFDYPDFLVASLTALAALAAIYHKAETGHGQRVEVAQVEAVGNTMGMAFMDYKLNGRPGEPAGNSHPVHAPYGIFPALGHDEWCAISCETDAEWQALVQAIGSPAWALVPDYATQEGRKANEDMLNADLSEWTRTQTPRQIMHLLQRAGVAATAVLTGEGLYWDPHLRERDYIDTLDHPDWGVLEQPGVTVRLSETPGGSRMPSAALGEHNDHVLKNILGLSDSDVEKLQQIGALA